MIYSFPSFLDGMKYNSEEEYFYTMLVLKFSDRAPGLILPACVSLSDKINTQYWEQYLLTN